MPNRDKQDAVRLLMVAAGHSCYDDPALIRHVAAWFEADVPAVVLRAKKLSVGEMVAIYIGYLVGNFGLVKNKAVRRCLVDRLAPKS